MAAVQNSALAPLLPRPPLMSLQKLRELTQPRWVCDVDRLRSDTGFTCPTPLSQGIAATADWYREARWL